MNTTEKTAFLTALATRVAERDLYLEVPESHLSDWGGEQGGQPLALVLPRSTAEVAAVVALCHQHQVPVVPQGGLSGLAGGAVPSEGCLLLSLSKMNEIEQLDAEAGLLRVQAGAVLQQVQEAAEAAGWMLALDLGARGSCQIGGNIATNAGGNRVIRYGVMRDLVLGLEVVLPDGQVLNLLQSMKKNNTGLDLRQLFIGTEGTLGIVTRAVLKLHPGVGGANTALIACDDYTSLLAFLRLAQQEFAGQVSAFEVMLPDYYQFALQALKRKDQFDVPHSHYVLFDVQARYPEQELGRFEALLEQAFEAGLVQDALLARSERETTELWQLRDAVAEILGILSPTLAFDIAVDIQRIGDLADQLKVALARAFPELTTLFFGHVGDGNLHILAGPVRGGKAEEQAIEALVYALTRDFAGSVSAEHGIGLHRKPWLGHSRTPAELSLMKAIKQAVDPLNLMNPGKILD